MSDKELNNPESNVDEILRRFVEEPERLYEEAASLAADEKQALYRIEESFAAALYAQALQPGTELDEGELARLADNPAAVTDAHPELQGILAAREIMSNSAIPSVPVPEVLKNLSRARSTREKAPAAPALIFRLAKERIEVIKSALHGILEMPVAVAAVRSAAAPVAEKQPRVELHQVTDELNLEYHVLRESERELMLSVRFRERKTGQYRVSLLREGRIIASEIMNGRDNSVSFTHLSSGFYEMEIKGPRELVIRQSILVEATDE